MSPKKKNDTFDSAHRKLVALHYFEEIILLLITAGAVMMSEVIQKMAKGTQVSNADITVDMVNVFGSMFLAVIIYGKRYTNFKDMGRVKPPFLLRACDAIIYGVGFRGIVGMGTGGIK